MTHVLSRSEVTGGIRALRRFGPGPMEIACPTVDAIGSRDLIELYLMLRGARKVLWRDDDGRTSERQRLPRILANLLSDGIAGPRQVVRQRSRAASAAKLAEPRLTTAAGFPGSSGRALYLRSDHWFGTRSGGSVGHVRGVIGGLRRSGVDVEVVATDRLAGVEANALFHLCRPVYGAGRNVPCVAELAYNDQMLAFVERNWGGWRPDFIYQRLSLCNLVGAELRRRHRVPYVVEYNGSLAWVARHWDGRPLLLERTALAIEHSVLRCADLIVVMSRASREDLIARGLAAERILVNPNGVDPDVYHPEVDGSAVRACYGMTDEIVIGFIGTFGMWHGAAVLARAFALLLSERAELRGRVRLFMIGDGPMKSAAERELHDAGFADRAIFTGLVPQDEGPAHLAACDILVSPHVSNPDGTPFFGSPTKLFEYMAMGRPIVASDLDQIGEVLRQDETAILVPPGNETALAHGLAMLVGDRALRTRLGSAARREAVTNHGWDAHVRRILSALGAEA